MTKKTVLFLCAVGLFFAQPLHAQKPHSELKNEIGVDAGFSSMAGSFVFGTTWFWSSLGASLNHKSVDTRLYGCYNLHYYYQVKHWCAVGMKFVVEGTRMTFYTDTTCTAVEKIDDDVFFSIMPSVRFTYLNRPWVRLYSSADIGVNFFFMTSSVGDVKTDCRAYFAWNITPIGVNVGKKFYGLFELNIGYDAIVKLGIGARF